ncbi:hypothetical protein BH11BAC2_BH11BAC2_01650 [soil metagenome]
MKTPKQRKQLTSFVILVVLVILYLLFFRKEENNVVDKRHKIDKREKAFRHNRVYYTKHARCRMDCRHIDESEIKEILEIGEINYAKSETNAQPCPKFALEGITHDKQHVRIIVGDCDSQASIITVIDLDTAFKCDCE